MVQHLFLTPLALLEVREERTAERTLLLEVLAVAQVTELGQVVRQLLPKDSLVGTLRVEQVVQILHPLVVAVLERQAEMPL